jgi:hypothetical protein
VTVFKFDLYRGLRLRQNEILDEAEALGRALGVPDALKGRIGVSASNSSAPGPLRPAVLEALVRGSGDYVPLVQIGDEVRRVVKSVLGDGYDAAVVNGAEAGLATSYAALLAPSQVGPGDSARARVVVPYERHIEHHASYGRAVPGIYKDIFRRPRRHRRRAGPAGPAPAQRGHRARQTRRRALPGARRQVLPGAAAAQRRRRCLGQGIGPCRRRGRRAARGFCGAGV